MCIQTDRDIVVKNKQEKKYTLIDMAFPSDNNISTKASEK